MAKFPTIEEFVQQVKERVLEEILIDGEPLGELIDSGDLVHIVRCKDCKYFMPQLLTDYNNYCYIRDGIVQQDEYCSKAERKEE